jgi:DNA repair protein RadA/Sms
MLLAPHVISNPAPGTVHAALRGLRPGIDPLCQGERRASVIPLATITQDGQVAVGRPRVVEHMVDAVLSYQRAIRAIISRMVRAYEESLRRQRRDRRLRNDRGSPHGGCQPPALFLARRDASAPGAAVLAGMKGRGPLLVEIQALVAPSPLGMPRRAVVGGTAIACR